MPMSENEGHSDGKMENDYDDDDLLEDTSNSHHRATFSSIDMDMHGVLPLPIFLEEPVDTFAAKNKLASLQC